MCVVYISGRVFKEQGIHKRCARRDFFYLFGSSLELKQLGIEELESNFDATWN